MSEENITIEAQPQADETVTEQPASTEETNNAAEQTEMFKYKYNHEDKEIPIEEARTLVQKGANYDKIQGKLEALESSPSLKFVERQAKKNNMSTEEYLDAVAKEETKNEINKIVEKEGVSESVAIKLYKADKDDKTRIKKEREEQDMIDFVKKYPDVKELSNDFWIKQKESGESLVDFYGKLSTKNEIQSLKDKLAKYESQEQISNKNTENAGASTGSVTGNGAAEHLFTRDQVKNMSRAEVNKNYNKIIESQKQWK